jgi:hypothetical protein
MTKMMRGKVYGRTIELDEDPGVAEGQEVEIEMMIAEATTPSQPVMSPGLAAIYAILGESFDTGEHDVAERHSEHQP